MSDFAVLLTTRALMIAIGIVTNEGPGLEL